MKSEALRNDGPTKDLVVHLLREGFANGLESVPFIAGGPTDVHVNFGGKSVLQLEWENRLWADIGRALSHQEVYLRISHAGRVRRAELEQALRSGRDRDPTGLFWSKRHLRPGMVTALVGATSTSPVAVAYLDMNGLKAINDDLGHAAGDAAIRAYLQSVAEALGDGAEGFRGDGGDELVVVMRNISGEQARGVILAALRAMGGRTVTLDQATNRKGLTAVCGIVVATSTDPDADALIARADAEQKRAKEASQGEVRRSVIAVEGGQVEFV